MLLIINRVYQSLLLTFFIMVFLIKMVEAQQLDPIAPSEMKSNVVLDCDLPEYFPGQLVVKLKQDHSMADLSALNTENEVITLKQLGLSKALEEKIGGKLYVLNFPVSSDVLKLAQVYSQHKSVLSTHPNYIYYPTIIPNDEYFNVWQSNLRQSNDKDIDADLAWDITQGSTTVKIGVIDSGIDPDHPELSNNLISGYDFTDVPYYDVWPWRTVGDYDTHDNDPHDEYGHGTHVTGISSAKGNNEIGIAGVNWNSKVVPIRASFTMLHRYPYDHHHMFFDTDNLITAVDYAISQGVRVINMSLGSYTDDQDFHAALQLAYQDSITLIAGAGNDAIIDSLFPAAYSEVIAVSSSNIDDELSWFSNYGSWIDVAAPGGTTQPGNYTAWDITSTMPTYTDFYMNTDDPIWDWSWYWPLKGTSMSVPHVTGIASLILSINPSYGPAAVRNFIQSTAEKVGGYSYDPVTGKSLEFGHGRVNAYDALANVLPENLTLENLSIGTTEIYVATNSITAGPNFTVESTGDVTFQAGNVITLKPGFTATAGSKFHAYIDEDLGGGLGKIIAAGPQQTGQDIDANLVGESVPSEYSLSHAYPNPFNPSTTIRFGLPEPARAWLVVYDLLGREVVRLAYGHLEAGYHAVVWNGRTAAGSEVPSGIYIARLITPGYTKSIKMLMLK